MKKIVKWVGVVVAVLVVLLVAAFLYVNNGSFIQRHVLPKVSEELGAPVVATSVDFSLMSGITLHGLTVGESTDPLVTAETVRVAYQFWPLLSGNVMVDEVLLENAVVDVREDKLPTPPVADDAADGDSSADSGKAPPVIRLQNIKLVNALVRVHTRATEDEPYTTVTLEKLNATVPSLGSGSDYTATIDGWLSQSRDGAPLLDKIQMAGTVSGGFDAAMAPTVSTGKLTLTGHEGGAQPAMAGRVAVLHWDVDVSNPAAITIKSVDVTETAGGKQEASASITGGVTEGEVNLKLALDVLSMEPLRVTGVTQPGMDLGKTRVNYAGTLNYKAASESVASAGTLTLREFTVADSERGLVAQAPMDLTVKHTLTYGPGGVSITTFEVNAAQGGKTLVTGTLNRPMTIDLNNPNALDSASASLGLTISAFPLTLLAPLMPPTAPAIQDGVLNGTLSVDVIGTGTQVAVVGQLDATNLDLLHDGKALSGLATTTRLDLQLADAKSLTIKALSLGLGQGTTDKANLIASASITGDLDLEAMSGTLAVNAQVSGATAQPLARQFVTDLDLGQTEAVYRATVTLAGDAITSKGVLVGLNLTAASESMKLPRLSPMNLNAEHDLTVDSVAGKLDVRTLKLTLADSERKLMTVLLEKPLSVTLGETVSLGQPTTLQVNVDRLPMALLKPAMASAPEDLDLGKTALTYAGRIDVASATQVAADGTLTISDFTATSAIMELPTLDPMSITARHVASYDTEKGQADLTQLTVKIADAARELLAVSLQEPARIVLDSPDKLAGNTRLTVAATRFPMGILKPFMPADLPVQVEEGEVTFSTEVAATDNGRTLQLKGDMSAPDMTLRQGERVFSHLAITKNWDVTIVAMNEVTIRDVKAVVSQAGAGGKHMVTMTQAGSLTLDPLGGKLTTTMDATGANLGPLVEAYAAGTSLGDAMIRYRGDTTFGDGGEQVSVTGDLQITNLNPANVARGTQIATPLDVSLQVAADYGLETQIVDLKSLGLAVTDKQIKLVVATLNKPYRLDLAALEVENAPPPLIPDMTVDVKDFDLARLTPLLPDDGSLRKLAGRLTLNARMSGQDERVFLKSDVTLTGLELHGVDGPTLTEPVNLTVALKANGDRTQMYTLDGATVKLSGATSKASLLALTMSGRFDGAFTPRESALTITSTETIDAQKLEALIAVAKPTTAGPAPAQRPVAAPQPGGTTTAEASNLPPLWATLDISLARIVYGEVYITDYRGKALLKDDILTIEHSGFKINDTGSGNLVGSADLHDLMMPTYAGKLNMKAIPVQPFIATFMPKWKIVTEGGLKSLDLDVTGRGRETMDVKRNLAGTMGLAVDRIQVVSIGGKAGQLFEQLVLQQTLGISTKDLLFTEGTMDGTIGGGRYALKQLLFLGPKLKITSAGRYYDFVAEPMDYDIRLTPYVTKEAERQLPSWAADLLADQGDGWYKSDEYPLTPRSLSLDGLGDVGKNLAIKKAKQEAAKRIGGALGGDAGGALDKAVGGDVGGAIGDALGGGLFGGGKKKPAEEPKPAPEAPVEDPKPAPETPAPAPAPDAPKPEKKDPAKGVLDLF